MHIRRNSGHNYSHPGTDLGGCVGNIHGLTAMASCRDCLRRTWGVMCLVTIEPAFFLVSMGSGLADTATKVLLFDKVCIMSIDDVGACVTRNMTSDDATLVQQQTSYWDFYRLASQCVPAIVMNILYANLSDRWSKKYTMLFYPAGSVVSSLIYVVCAVYVASSPAYLLLSSLVIGVSGSMLTLIGACFSYLSATAPEDNLIIHISVAEAALLASSSISSFAAGVLLDAYGCVIIYIVSIPFYVLTIIYVVIRLRNIPPKAIDKEPQAKSTYASLARPVEPIDGNNEIADVDRPRSAEAEQSEAAAASSLAAPSEATDANTTTSLKDFGREEFQSPTAPAASFVSVNADLVEATSGDLAVSYDLTPSSEISMLRETSVNSQTSLLGETSSESNFSAIGRLLLSYFRDYIGTVARRRELKKRRAIIAILSIILIEMMCSYAAGTGLSYLFVIQEPLSWSTAVYGFYTGTTRFIKGFCFLVILPLAKKLGVPYAIIIIISLTSSIIGHTIFSVSLYTWMAFLSAALNLFGSASIVTARSFIVKFVNEEEHGKAFGIIASLETLGTLLSSAIFNIGIYPATVEIFSGLAILIASVLLLVPLSTAIWLHIFVRNMARLQSNLQSINSVGSQ